MRSSVGAKVWSLSGLLSSNWVSLSCREELVCLTRGAKVEGRVAEGSRDAEEGSGARVRRSRCGPETPLAGRSVCHSPLPTPSINNSRAEIAPVNPSVPQTQPWCRTANTCLREARCRSSPTTPEELGVEVAGGRTRRAHREVTTFLFFAFGVCVFVVPVRQSRTV